jgi:hypothetical protein
MRPIRPLIIAALLCGAASSAHAERYELGILSGANLASFDSMDAIAEDRSYATFGLSAAMKIPELSLLEGFRTEIDLRWETGSLGGTSFERINSDLEMDSLILGARLRRELSPRLSLFGRAGLGVTWASLDLRDSIATSTRQVHDEDRAALSTAALGADFEIGKRANRAFHIGLRAELGYSLLTDFDFSATPMGGGDDELSIPVMSAAIGSVNASGPLMRFAVVGAF